MTLVPPSPVLTLDAFTPLVGKRLTIHSEPAEIELTLVEATALRNDRGSGRPPFILIFRSDPTALLTDGIYTMRAQGFGPAQIFVSTMLSAPNAEPGFFYQAIFN